MIISCPHCESRFLLNALSNPEGFLRCGVCGHIWDFSESDICEDEINDLKTSHRNWESLFDQKGNSLGFLIIKNSDKRDVKINRNKESFSENDTNSDNKLFGRDVSDLKYALKDMMDSYSPYGDDKVSSDNRYSFENEKMKSEKHVNNNEENNNEESNNEESNNEESNNEESNNEESNNEESNNEESNNEESNNEESNKRELRKTEEEADKGCYTDDINDDFVKWKFDEDIDDGLSIEDSIRMIEEQIFSNKEQGLKRKDFQNKQSSVNEDYSKEDIDKDLEEDIIRNAELFDDEKLFESDEIEDDDFDLFDDDEEQNESEDNLAFAKEDVIAEKSSYTSANLNNFSKNNADDDFEKIFLDINKKLEKFFSFSFLKKIHSYVSHWKKKTFYLLPNWLSSFLRNCLLASPLFLIYLICHYFIMFFGYSLPIENYSNLNRFFHVSDFSGFSLEHVIARTYLKDTSFDIKISGFLVNSSEKALQSPRYCIVVLGSNGFSDSYIVPSSGLILPTKEKQKFQHTIEDLSFDIKSISIGILGARGSYVCE